MSFKHMFPQYFQVYQSAFGFWAREDAQLWAEANQANWETFLRARGEWKEGCSVFFAGAKPYHTVTPLLTAKVDVYDVTWAGLRFLGANEFKPGIQRVCWGCKAKVVAQLRVGGYSADWESPMFGLFVDTPETITVTNKQLVDWAQKVLDDWQARAEDGRCRHIDQMWNFHIHTGAQVPEGAPAPITPLETMARRDFRHMLTEALDAIQGYRWVADDLPAHMAQVEGLTKFFEVSAVELSVLHVAQHYLRMDPHPAAVKASQDYAFALAWEVTKTWAE